MKITYENTEPHNFKDFEALGMMVEKTYKKQHTTTTLEGVNSYEKNISLYFGITDGEYR